VIELGIQPVVGCVASVAGGREFRCYVVGVPGRLEIVEVTRGAGRGHRLKVAGRSTFMAGIAIHRSVRTGQRKSIIVLLYLLN
jgi:hypothetical protein